MRERVPDHGHNISSGERWSTNVVPMRKGDRSMLFTPDGLREGETETQGWLQVRSSGRGKPWRGARGKEERRERGGEGGERRGEGNEGQLSGLS